MKKILNYLPLVPLTLTACSQKPAQEEVKRPNILFIMTDDHTTQAISAYGSEFANTPNIDRIAHEGARFDNCFVTNALSGPSRACILTGKFGHINGFTDNSQVFDGSQKTFPKLLRENGYQTAIIGKWHLISEPQGFDFYSILTGQHEQGDYYDPDFLENGKDIVEKGYATDIITEKALTYLKEQRDKNKPFAMMVHHKAPHRNWMAAERHLGYYNDVTFPEPFNLFDDYATRSKAPKEQDCNIANTLTDYWDLKLATEEELASNDFPDKRFQGVYNRMPESTKKRWNEVYAERIHKFRNTKMTEKELVREKFQSYMRDYMSTTLAVDEGIGKLLDYLEETGELDNTLIIYTSDQGFFLGEHGFFDKRFMYEECQRMPLVMRYPKLIKAGTKAEAFAMNVDFAPTFLDLAGVEKQDDIQGTSLLPIFQNEGKAPEGWRDAVYYHYFEYPAEHSVKRHYGVRTDRYKLIHFYNDINEWEMYDLENDPHEMNNIYGKADVKEIQNHLKVRLDELRVQYNDTIQ